MAAVVTVAACAIVGLVLYPRLSNMGRRDSEHATSCQDNLRRIGLSMLQYSQDYGGRFPPRTGSPKVYGWVNALAPYGAPHQLFYCPQVEAERSEDPRQLGYSDYWMNANLFAASSKKFSANSTILVGDGNDGQDATTARYSASALPAAWRTDHESPAYRHLGMMNILFADGHIKAMKPDQIVNTAKSGYASFALK